jgi:hypothetical protein
MKKVLEPTMKVNFSCDDGWKSNNKFFLKGAGRILKEI